LVVAVGAPPLQPNLRVGDESHGFAVAGDVHCVETLVSALLQPFHDFAPVVFEPGKRHLFVRQKKNLELSAPFVKVYAVSYRKQQHFGEQFSNHPKHAERVPDRVPIDGTC
jgi:hypothetical protein